MKLLRVETYDLAQVIEDCNRYQFGLTELMTS